MYVVPSFILNDNFSRDIALLFYQQPKYCNAWIKKSYFILCPYKNKKLLLLREYGITLSKNLEDRKILTGLQKKFTLNWIIFTAKKFLFPDLDLQLLKNQ